MSGVSVALAAGALCCSVSTAWALGDDFAAAPAFAAELGFTRLTFDSDFTELTVDVTDSRKPSFDWYPFALFGTRTTQSSYKLRPDNAVELTAGDNNRNSQLATVLPNNRPQRYIGRAFGGGGYFEATLSFDPQDVVAHQFNGWPSFWAVGVEAAFGVGGRPDDFWPGQVRDYRHNVEVDAFEFDDPHPAGGGKSLRYGVALHDWYGVYGQTCAHMCQAQTPIAADPTPPETDFKESHRYGFLWKMASETERGYVEFYFDRVAIGRSTSWVRWGDKPRLPPPRGDWLYSILDRQHLALILGTGAGQRMLVSSVRVWQRE